ncbi:MAG: DUF1015 family protein, partial [Solirubrobacteraceae bacterium]
MAEIQPIRALRYDPGRTGGLEDVVAPPYDVIDEQQRAALEARSPYNVVRIDLPRGGEDRYDRAAALLDEWREQGAVVLDEQPALWTLAQGYVGPDGERRTRQGVFARVRVEEYGPGRIRPHERTHPGPREDRLRLTRATHANLSPIFSLFSDPSGAVADALSRAGGDAVWAQTTDDDGTVNRLGRVDDAGAIAEAAEVLAGTELLIADGHHRYETARVYAEEIGGEGPHRYVLMCLVALQDSGLTVFPTHRLIRGLAPEQHETLANALRRDFEIQPLDDTAELAPEAGDTVRIGYIDAHFKKPFRLTLKDASSLALALPDKPDAYRMLDTAALEALILRGPAGLSEDDISHLNGLAYSKDTADALGTVSDGRADAAFIMR